MSILAYEHNDVCIRNSFNIVYNVRLKTILMFKKKLVQVVLHPDHLPADTRQFLQNVVTPLAPRISRTHCQYHGDKGALHSELILLWDGPVTYGSKFESQEDFLRVCKCLF